MTQTSGTDAGAPESGASSTVIEERYGRSRQRGIDRRLGWIIAGAAVLLGSVVLLFGGWQTTSTIEYRDLAYSVENDREVQVRFEVTAPPGSELVCALEALSTSKATVGWKIVELAPSDQRTRRFSESLVTTAPATTGVVRSCWVTVTE